MLLWMAKQSTLNSKLVIVSVDRGGHFWQWFNLSSTKGHIGQMRVGKSPSPRFQTTSCPICESLCKTARWGKWERKNHKLLLYSFAAFCSHHGYVGCKTLPEKDFVSKLQKSTYINMLNSGCIWSLQTKPWLWGLCCKRPCKRPLSCPYPARRALCSLWCHLWRSPWNLFCSSLHWCLLPCLFSGVNVTRHRSWDDSAFSFPSSW